MTQDIIDYRGRKVLLHKKVGGLEEKIEKQKNLMEKAETPTEFYQEQAKHYALLSVQQELSHTKEPRKYQKAEFYKQRAIESWEKAELN